MHKKVLELVIQVRSGDVPAREMLYRKCFPKIYFFAVSLLKDRQAAEHFTKIIFIDIFNHITKLEDIAKFDQWLGVVVFSQMRRLIDAKWQSSLQMDFSQGYSYEGQALVPADLFVHTNRVSAVTNAIAQLPVHEKMTLYGMHYFGLNIQKVSTILKADHKYVSQKINSCAAFISKETKRYAAAAGIGTQTAMVAQLGDLLYAEAVNIRIDTETALTIWDTVYCEIQSMPTLRVLDAQPEIRPIHLHCERHASAVVPSISYLYRAI